MNFKPERIATSVNTTGQPESLSAPLAVSRAGRALSFFETGTGVATGARPSAAQAARPAKPAKRLAKRSGAGLTLPSSPVPERACNGPCGSPDRAGAHVQVP